MAHISLSLVPEAIKNRLEFSSGQSSEYGGSTLTARWEDGEYVVRSYKATIALAKANGRYWVTDTKYTVTTSKHTSFVRRGFASDGAPVSLEDVRA
jgi:hypothetical protein